MSQRPGFPVKLSQTPGEVRHRAPLLGDHTREILSELGLSEARVDQLVANGAVVAR